MKNRNDLLSTLLILAWVQVLFSIRLRKLARREILNRMRATSCWAIENKATRALSDLASAGTGLFGLTQCLKQSWFRSNLQWLDLRHDDSSTDTGTTHWACRLILHGFSSFKIWCDTFDSFTTIHSFSSSISKEVTGLGGFYSVL